MSAIVNRWFPEWGDFQANQVDDDRGRENPVDKTKRCVAGACVLKGSSGGSSKTCSAYAAICSRNLGGSPKCAAARASCMQTGVYQGPSGRVFYGMLRQ